MSDFKAKMHPIRFLLWLCLRSVVGDHSAPKTPGSIYGPISKARERKIIFSLPSRILTCTELKGHWLCLF